MEYKKKKGIKYTIVSIKIPMEVIDEERQTIQQPKREKTKRKRLHKKLKIVSDVIIPVIIVDNFMK